MPLPVWSTSFHSLLHVGHRSWVLCDLSIEGNIPVVTQQVHTHNYFFKIVSLLFRKTKLSNHQVTIPANLPTRSSSTVWVFSHSSSKRSAQFSLPIFLVLEFTSIHSSLGKELPCCYCIHLIPHVMLGTQ